MTTTSGPGLDLKSETIGLAIALELPMIIVDIQRGGPSTGLPTKAEQSDLLHAMYGRHGEAPFPIVASYSPPSCFWAAIEAARIAIKYMTPVILLSDGYLANGAEPWRITSVEKLPDISREFASQPNVGDDFWPYLRDDETLARPWAIPGTPGLEHRVGGLEKADGTGNISYEPENHELMSDVARGQDQGHRGGHRPTRVAVATRMRACWSWVGIDVRRDRRRVQAPAVERQEDRARSSEASSTRSRRTPTSAAALRRR